MFPSGDGQPGQAPEEHKNVSMDRSQSTSGHLCVDGHGPVRRRDYIRKERNWQWFISIKTTVTILFWTSTAVRYMWWMTWFMI